VGPKAKVAVPYLIKRVADERWSASIWAEHADPFGGGKTAALEAVKALAPDQVTAALLAARKSSNPRVKAWALTELGKLKEN
jgi:hypothetical protein